MVPDLVALSHAAINTDGLVPAHICEHLIALHRQLSLINRYFIL